MTSFRKFKRRISGTYQKRAFSEKRLYILVVPMPIECISLWSKLMNQFYLLLTTVVMHLPNQTKNSFLLVKDSPLFSKKSLHFTASQSSCSQENKSSARGTNNIIVSVSRRFPVVMTISKVAGRKFLVDYGKFKGIMVAGRLRQPFMDKILQTLSGINPFTSINLLLATGKSQ